MGDDINVMASDNATSPGYHLGQITNAETHNYLVPAKKINDGEDLAFFFVSKAYRDLTKWLLQLNRAMFPSCDNSDHTTVHRLDEPPGYSRNVQAMRELLSSLSSLVETAPPDTGPRRFGNVAFRTWHQLADESAADLIRKHLGQALPTLSEAVVDELKAYLAGSFGSSQRLDYGTGHELNFLAFLGGLWKLNVFVEGDECAVVIGIVQPYLELVRKLIITYTLEPAGSHGVWGLDDHSFVPYIFGSAQMGPAIAAGNPSSPVPTEGSLRSAPAPSSVMDKPTVIEQKHINMYFSAIAFIYDVKKGPFWEHSPVLYDISGIKDGWGKINKGMLKMYVAEVLGKFPVVQHFPFGSLFEWEQQEGATLQTPSIHSQQQPAAMQSMDVPPAASHGTSAPWSRQARGVVPPMQANTVMPSTRAPWATAVGAGRALGNDTSVGHNQRGPLPPKMAPHDAPLRQKD